MDQELTDKIVAEFSQKITDILNRPIHLYKSVQDPFFPGHFTIVKYEQGTEPPLTSDEKRFYALPFWSRIWVRIQFHWLRLQFFIERHFPRKF